MSEEESEQPVKITAEARAHPAIRILARACIALALQRQDPITPKQSREGSPVSEERADD